MLTAKEIYVLGKAAVDENREDYYQGVGSDIISTHPEKFIEKIDAMIAKLERVQNFAIDYQDYLENLREEDDEYM